jgi:hypothetical protein
MKPPPFRGLSRCERLEADMRYRDVDYTLVQGQGGQLWKWSFALHNKPHTGEAGTKAEAVSQAERAIDRALVFGKLGVIRRELEG